MNEKEENIEVKDWEPTTNNYILHIFKDEEMNVMNEMMIIIDMNVMSFLWI